MERRSAHVYSSSANAPETVGQGTTFAAPTTAGPFILNLPVELLRQIFLLVRSADSQADRDRWYGGWQGPCGRNDLIVLSAICSYLRTVALGTPMLWGKIEFTGVLDVYNWNALCIERSETCPIDIVIDWRSDRYCQQEDLRGALSLVIPHISRWKSLQFYAYPSDVTRQFMQQLKPISSAPRLEELYLCYINGWGWGELNESLTRDKRLQLSSFSPASETFES